MDWIAIGLMLAGAASHFAFEHLADKETDESKQHRYQRAAKLCLIVALVGLAMGVIEAWKRMPPPEQRVPFK